MKNNQYRRWYSRSIFLFSIAIHLALFSLAQELPATAEQQLENLAGAEQTETEDDSYLQSLSKFRKNPLDINKAEKEEWEELGILTDRQVENFMQYRRLLGKITDKYELQAIPGWDLLTIRRLLPYVTVETSVPFLEDWHTCFSKGEHTVLIRVSEVFEPGDKNENYAGSPQKIFLRYKYSYKRLLQFGITGDKDAGERFFSGRQKAGFDFYSFHFFIRPKGIIQALALGDFTVNMGQGLIQWQGMAFKKSAMVMGIKRQSPVIRPYNSAGEFNFHRGAAITIQKRKWQGSGFFSCRHLSASLENDTVNAVNYFSSFQTSGYHRTINEIAAKNALQQIAWGGNLEYTGHQFQIGFNYIGYQFSAALQKRQEPYNLYAIAGDRWFNASADYSYTYKNLHGFGEMAIDKKGHKAFINGVLLSVDDAVDLSVLQRSLPAAYQSLNSNAFTENTLPADENGCYVGILMRPASGWQISLYADFYCFPWLKYQVDAPGQGKDFLMQVNYTPNRRAEFYTRYKTEGKPGNKAGDIGSMSYPILFQTKNWRTQFNYKANATISLRNRLELTAYKSPADNSVTGFLFYTDITYKPLMKPFSVAARWTFFETEDNNTRVYTYENDVSFSYAIPSFSGKGHRYYLLFNYDLDQQISFSLRWAQTFYKDTILSNSNGLPLVTSIKSEIKMQILLRL